MPMRAPRGNSSKSSCGTPSTHAATALHQHQCAPFPTQYSHLREERRKVLINARSTIEASTQQQLSARGDPGTHRLISSPPVKNAAGSRTTYYTFTGAVGRQTPLLLKSVGPVWHLKWLRPAAPLPCRLWPLWRTRRPGGWATTTFSLWSQKITCIIACIETLVHFALWVIGLVRPRRNSYLRILLVRRSLHQVHMHNVVISALRGPPTQWRCQPPSCIVPFPLGAACMSEPLP
jgi:hypothetical protein